jgi:hypothetical protein
LAKNESREQLLAKILTFLLDIGIEVNFESLTEPTFLPGIDVRHGVLVVDESKLKYPGDLLHEAGHIAVVTPERRKGLRGSVGQKAYEEMTAIAWSYAAAVRLGIDAAVLFHPDGYRGGSQSLIENFTNGRYIGVSTLEWLGLTVEPRRAVATGGASYPQMQKWMLD